MLHFPTNALTRPLEDFLREVQQGPGQALQMPVQLKWGGGLGSGVHALQIVASWARIDGSNRTLQLPVSFSDNAITRERFASTIPGMAALYFAQGIRCGDKSIDRYKALEAVAPRVTAMQTAAFRDTLRGQGVALCCFHGAKSEFLRALYGNPMPGEVRPVSDFRVLLPRLLEHVGARAIGMLNEGQLDYLSALLYQLFLNADEHGSYAPDGERYESGVRGIVLRMTTIPSIKELVGLAGDDTPFRTYVSKLGHVSRDSAPRQEPKSGSRTAPTRLVEISVFDTGPGMGLRWLADKVGRRSYAEFPLEEEFEAVQTCFQKHATTKASQYFGQGLPVAIGAMKRLNAFMSLRTGRLSLYQDFSRLDTAEFQPKNRFPKRMSLPAIAGTGYTICFKVQ